MADQDPCGLLMLPTDVLENILSRLGKQVVRGGGTQFAAWERVLFSHLKEGEKERARETASLASCSSLATVRVMQCLPCKLNLWWSTRALKPSETTDGVIAKLASTARSMGLAPGDLRGEVCVYGLFTNVLDYDVIIDRERRLRAFPPVLRCPLECGMLGTIRRLNLSAAGFRRLPEGMSALAALNAEERQMPAFPPVLRRPLECGMLRTVRKLELSRGQFRRLPEGMSALAELHVVACCNLDECWLPESSGRRIRKLRVADSNVVRLPESMEALDELDVSGYRHLDAENHGWLPRSSRRRVRKLFIEDSKLTSVPDGMEALETLSVSGAYIDEDWLPRDSRRWVKTLAASASTVACIPEDMPELESLMLHMCYGLDADMSLLERLELMPEVWLKLSQQRLNSDTWLPPSSSGRLRKIIAWGIGLRRLPENLEALEYVNVDRCGDLAEDWLPESSAKHVAFVLARGSNIRKLPANMAELAFVDVSYAPYLEADFLPVSSGRAVSFVCAKRSNIRRLPAHMDHLLYLNVTDCLTFDDVHGVPASSRGKLWPLQPRGQAPADDTQRLGRASELNFNRLLQLLAESWNGVQRSPHYVDDFFGNPDPPHSDRCNLSRSPIGALREAGLYRAWYRLQEMFGSATLQTGQEDE